MLVVVFVFLALVVLFLLAAGAVVIYRAFMQWIQDTEDFTDGE